MSSVRMCDQCGTVFSERADDWSTYSGSRRKRDTNGQVVTISDTLDACPDCTAIRFTPRAELPTTASPRYEDSPLNT